MATGSPARRAEFSQIAAIACAEIVLPNFAFSEERWRIEDELAEAKTLDDLSPDVRALVQPVFDRFAADLEE